MVIKSNKKRILLVTALLVFTVALLTVWLLLLKKKPSPITSAPTPYLMSSFSVYGRIDKVADGVVWLRNLPPGPMPQKNIVTYQFMVNPDTQFTTQSIPPVYLFKTVTPTLLKLDLKDLKAGQFVIVTTDKDLQSGPDSQFRAVSIRLSQGKPLLNGKITAINGNIITLKNSVKLLSSAVSPGSSAPEKEYTITVNGDTEISYLKQGVPQKLTLADLKVDMPVIIYSDDDFTKTRSLTALRIEPLAPITPTLEVSPLTPSSSKQ